MLTLSFADRDPSETLAVHCANCFSPDRSTCFSGCNAVVWLGNRYAAPRVYHADRGTAAAWPFAAHAQPPARSQQGPTAPSYESTLNAIRWRAAWVSPLSRNHHER